MRCIFATGMLHSIRITNKVFGRRSNLRVKRLEIKGFKSFKDKTVIHFDEGVTGIVGPYGCGKSNLVDSFFWVMGERSNKHMRADGSQDLIFNGSEKYSPLGMAEVSLILATGASAATLP